MDDKSNQIWAIGRSISRRIFLLMALVVLFIGMVFFFYIIQQKNIEQFKHVASDYHAKTIRLSLEMLDEIGIRRLLIHREIASEVPPEVPSNFPRVFSFDTAINNMRIILHENEAQIIDIQNKFDGNEFKGTIIRLIRSYEKVNNALENTGDRIPTNSLDKNLAALEIVIKQLELLHDDALVKLRNSITEKQADYDIYILYAAIVGFIAVLSLVISFVRNIKSILNKYKKLLMELGYSRENTAALLHATDQGIYGLDMQGICIFANTACLKMFGYASSVDIVGKNMHQLTHHSHVNGDDYPLEECKIYNASKAGEHAKCADEVFWHKDGTSFPVEYSSNPIRMNGELNGSVIAFNDITERRRIENELKNHYHQLETLVDIRTQDLQTAKVEAEQANKHKSEFLSRMSHELRTPMNAILGFGQLVEKEEMPAKQKSFIEEIMSAGRHLLKLIDEVLDLSSIEAGKINLVFEDFNAGDLINECIVNMQTFSVQHGVTLSVKNDICSNVNMRMDRMRVKEVLQNLISNAIKYNDDDGAVLINCEQVTSEKLRINVVDTGPGISKEHELMLFEPFNRLGKEYGDIEGTGIGLSIAKRLMELMDGEIGVQSVPSGGSVFWIECNIGHSISQFDARKEPLGNKNKLSTMQCKALYVEDNPANMRLLENVFLNHGIAKLYTAPTAEMGIELARECKPDVILMDINLPGMDGYEALSRLRNYPETIDIPIIAISAAAMPRDIDRGLAAGFKYYLAKPIDVYELLDAIKNLLQKKYVSGSA